MGLAFKKAVKYEAKGRMALIGPAGSGKSWTMLTAARALVGPNGKIAAVDTEHGSLSKYADEFSFDVIEPSSYSVETFLSALRDAEKAGYDAFCCDSLSHFWMGKDGALEFVDMAAKRHRDQMGGWKEFRPHERAMVDAMIASPCHIFVTMRTKTEYQEQVNPSTGKKQRVKIGLAPVQREGLEFEFDLVGYMDEDNTLIVDKTRCKFYNGKALTKPSAKDFQTFAEWLKGAPQEKRSIPIEVHQSAEKNPNAEHNQQVLSDMKAADIPNDAQEPTEAAWDQVAKESAQSTDAATAMADQASEFDIKQIWDVAKAEGFTQARVIIHMRKDLGVAESRLLTKSQVAEIIGWMKRKGR